MYKIEPRKDTAVYLLIDGNGFVVNDCPGHGVNVGEFTVKLIDPKRKIQPFFYLKNVYNLEDRKDRYFLLISLESSEADLDLILKSKTEEVDGRRRIIEFNIDMIDPMKNGDIPALHFALQDYKYNVWRDYWPTRKGRNFLGTDEVPEIKPKPERPKFKLSNMEKVYARCSHIDGKTGETSLCIASDKQVKCIICGKTFTLPTPLAKDAIETGVEMILSSVEECKQLLSFKDLTPEEFQDIRDLSVALEHLKLFPDIYEFAKDKNSGDI